MYGNPVSGGGIGSSGSGGLPNAIANRGASSYFNKGVGSNPPSNGALPTLGSGGISGNNPTQKGQLGSYGGYNKNSAIGANRGPPGLAAMGGYKYGGISGGLGGSGIGAMAGRGMGLDNYGARDPYIENSQGA